MAVYVFVVALLNLVLGYLLANLLTRKSQQYSNAASLPFGGLSHGQSSAGSAASMERRKGSGVAVEAEPVDDHVLMEASIDEFKAGLNRYRNELAQLDRRMRNCSESPDPQAVQECIRDLMDVNDHYLEHQGEAKQRLHERFGEDAGESELAPLGGQIEQAITQQAQQVETANQTLGQLDIEDELLNGCQRLLDETSKLTGANQELDRTLNDAQSELVRRSTGAADPLAALGSRSQLEGALADWCRDDPSRRRPLTVALVDVDRFGNVNDAWGNASADKVLSTVAEIITSATRDNDVAVRYSGQRFAMMFPDSDARTSINAIERIRQSVAAVQFQHSNRTVEVTVSCAVTQATGSDSTDSLLARIESTLQDAKKHGRNCTFLHNGQSSSPIMPQEFSLDSRTVAV